MRQQSSVLMSELIAVIVMQSLLILSVNAKTPGWPSPYWDIPGDFCRARYHEQRCCEGRNDPCSVPIMGTLCYCDNFCNRTDSSDCCPDYFSHCEGLNGDDKFEFAEGAPEEIVRPQDLECPHGVRTLDQDPKCYDEGRFYSTRETITKNCNKCRCQVSLQNPQCMELLCETDECYLDGDLFARLEDDFYRGGITWRPKNSSLFWGHSMLEIIQKRLGTKLPEEQDRKNFDMIPIKFQYDSNSFPSRFDAREKWGNQIHPILDQGWCAASWAFSTISVASDRLSIDTEGEINHEMAPQSLISCNTHGQFGCNGGYIDRAWNFLRKYGTVPDTCYAYEEGQSSCQLPRSGMQDILKPAFQEKFEILRNCEALKGRRGLFRMQPSYRVGRANSPKHPRRTEHDMMFEIMTHGPVQAIMEVHKDFILYGSGVYQKTYHVTGQTIGHHSVKIIGWGSENDVNYWLVANSWGTEWGENGYFRIRRGSNECMIESQVVGAWAQTQEVTEEIETFRQKNRRQRQRRSRRHHHSKLN